MDGDIDALFRNGRASFAYVAWSDPAEMDVFRLGGIRRGGRFVVGAPYFYASPL